MSVLIPLVVCLMVLALVIHAIQHSAPLDDSTVREIRETVSANQFIGVIYARRRAATRLHRHF